MVCRVTTLLVCLLLLNSDDGSTQEVDPAKAFEQAISAADRGALDEAVAFMEKVRSVDPDHPSMLWNLGIWHAELGNHQGSLAR